jgi:molybdenum cofactor guanylyltransferase
MNKYFGKYSGILLAGGKSSRMGEDKAFLRYQNRYLFEYSLSILRLFSKEILLSSGNLRFKDLEYPCIADEISNLGPLGGIYSCLKRIKNESAIVLPCDLPFITEKTVKYLIKNSDGFSITIALNHENRPEPLIGIYSSTLIPVIEEMIHSNKYKMQELFLRANTNFVMIPNIKAETFLNINYPDDFNSLQGS